MQFMNFKNLIVMNKQTLLDLNGYKIYLLPGPGGPIAKSAVNPIADPGVVSLIQDWHHTSVEIDCKLS